MPRKGRKKVRFSISISRVLLERVKQLSEKLSLSPSDIIESALINYLRELNFLGEEFKESSECEKKTLNSKSS